MAMTKAERQREAAHSRRVSAARAQLYAAGAKRASRIKRLRDAGLTWAEIGERMELSRQRVHQIWTRYYR